MVVSFATQIGHRKDVNSSRSYNFLNEDELCGELFYSKALELILDSTESVKPKGELFKYFILLFSLLKWFTRHTFMLILFVYLTFVTYSVS